MKPRWALVIDHDKEWSELVSRALSPLGLTVEVSSDAGASLDRVVELCPEIVFIAAHLPDRAGFAIADEIKGLDDGIRVVMAGAAIPEGDAELRATLTGRADRYLERPLAEPDLVQVTAQLLGIEIQPPAPHETATAQPPASPEPASPQASASPEPPGPDDPIDRLRVEFAVARRESRSSRSSAGNLALHAHVDEKDAEIARLQTELIEREERIVAIQRKRRQVVAEMAQALRLTRKSHRDLEILLDSAQSTADITLREREDIEKLHELDHQEHADHLQKEEERRREAETQVAELKSRALESQRRSDLEIAALRAAHAETLESQAAEHSRVLRESAEELAAAKDASAAREQDLRAHFEAFEARLRGEKEQELAAAHAARVQALAAQDKDHVAALRRSTEEKQALKISLQQMQETLLQHQAKLAEADAQIARAESLFAQHDEQAAALRRTVDEKTTLEAALRVLQEAVQRQEAALTVAAADARQLAAEHERGLAALEGRLAAEKDQALAALQTAARAREQELQQHHDVTLAHALSAKEDEHRRTLQRSAEAFMALKATTEAREKDLRAQHESQLAQADAHAQAVRTQALAAQDKEHAAVLRRHAEEVAALKTAIRHDQDLVQQHRAKLAAAEIEAKRHAEEHQRAVSAAEQELAAAHAARAQALAAQDKEHAVREKEHAAALRRSAEDVAALKNALHHEQEVLHHHKARLAAAEAESKQRAEDHRRAAAAFEQELAAAHTAHAQAVAARDAEHAAAVRRMAEEAAAMKASLLQEHETVERYRVQLAEAELAARRLETTLHAEKDEAIAALQAAQTRALADRVQELQQQHERHLAEAQGRAEEQQRATEEQQRATAALAQALAQAESEGGARTKEHAGALRRASEEAQALKGALEQTQDAVRQLEARLQQAEAESRTLDAVLRAEREQTQAREEELRALHEATHTRALAAQDSEHLARLAEATAETLRAVDEHRRATAALEARLRDEKEQELAAAAQHAAEEMSALRAALERERQAAITLERRLHAEGEQALTTLRQQYETRLEHGEAQLRGIAEEHQRTAAALRRASDEAATLKAALQREQEAAEERNARVAEIEAEARRRADEDQRAAAALETRLRAEKDDELAAAHAARAQAVAAQDKAHAAALRRAADEAVALKAALQREQEAAEQRRAHIAEIEAQARRRADEDQRAAAALEARLRAEKDDALAALAAAHAQALAAKDAEREAALGEAGEKQKAVMLRAQHADQELRRHYEMKLAELQAAVRRQAEENQRETAALVASLQAEKEQDLAAAQAARVQALAALDREHAAALRRASEEIKALKSALPDDPDGAPLKA